MLLVDVDAATGRRRVTIAILNPERPSLHTINPQALQAQQQKQQWQQTGHGQPQQLTSTQPSSSCHISQAGASAEQTPAGLLRALSLLCYSLEKLKTLAENNSIAFQFAFINLAPLPKRSILQCCCMYFDN